MRIFRLFVLGAMTLVLTFGLGVVAASAQTGYGDDVVKPRTLTVDPGDSGETASSSDDDGTSTGVLVGLVAGGLAVIGGAGYGLYRLRSAQG